MSVGTIVTIVLLMAMLVLGLVLVRTIFTGSTENIKDIDRKVKDQITKLFAEKIKTALNKIELFENNYKVEPQKWTGEHANCS